MGSLCDASHCHALLRCHGLVDETLRTKGAHLKTLEMSSTLLNPDGCRAGPLGRPHCSCSRCMYWHAVSTLQLITAKRRRFTSPYGKKQKWMERQRLQLCLSFCLFWRNPSRLQISM